MCFFSLSLYRGIHVKYKFIGIIYEQCGFLANLFAELDALINVFLSRRKIEKKSFRTLTNLFSTFFFSLLLVYNHSRIYGLYIRAHKTIFFPKLYALMNVFFCRNG